MKGDKAMRNLEGRLQRIEKEVNTENEMTEEDLLLVLSVLPEDFRMAIINEMRAIIEKDPGRGHNVQPVWHSKTKKPSGLHGENLQKILETMPCEEWKEALIRKVNERG